jgi:hypothetical protein
VTRRPRTPDASLTERAAGGRLLLLSGGIVMRNLTTAVLCAVLAASALAADDDAETRFHRAYEQEVVEGKVADAARVYLELMRDEKAPQRWRSESKFRFAVASILLGRADEGRAHLAEIVKDQTVSETLRTRAAEYLDAAKGIGVGGELEKKLQALVFELAKQSPGSDDVASKVYRDFEVVGKQAVPFLKQLARHPDLMLRQHAFRILLRLKEPGTMEFWSPDVHAAAVSSGELAGYLASRPDEATVFEQKLRSLNNEQLAVALSAYAPEYRQRPAYSVDLLREAQNRKIAPALLTGALADRSDDDALRLRLEWIRSPEVELSTAASLSFVRAVPREVPALVPVEEIFPLVAERLLTQDLAWDVWTLRTNPTAGDPQRRKSFEGFVALTKSVPVRLMLDALDKAVARSQSDPLNKPSNPWNNGFLEALAFAIEDANPAADDLVRYAGLLRKWSDQGPPKQPTGHLLRVIEKLPETQAVEFVRWYFARSRQPQDAQYILRTASAGRPLVGLEAVRAAIAGPAGADVLNALPIAQNASVPTPEQARTMLALAPELVRAVQKKFPSVSLPVGGFPWQAAALPAEEAQECLLATAAAVFETPAGKIRDQAVINLLPVGGYSTAFDTYWTAITPSLEKLLTLPGVESSHDRAVVIHQVARALQEQGTPPRLRAVMAPFLLAHVDEVPDPSVFVKYPDVFPPTAWVPRVRPSLYQLPNMRLADPVADATVRELTKDPAKINASVLAFAAASASPQVRGEVFDYVLRSAPVEQLGAIVEQRTYGSAEAREGALQRLVSAPAPNLAAIGMLLQGLVNERPSERLFPAIRLVLASEDHAMNGVDAAKSLGREDLLPDLAKLLDSMNAPLRQKAREAIDSIVELRRLKEEALRNARK